MTVAAARILAVKVGTSIERPACLVSPPSLFRACYEHLEIEVGFLPNMA